MQVNGRVGDKASLVMIFSSQIDATEVPVNGITPRLYAISDLLLNNYLVKDLILAGNVSQKHSGSVP